MSGITLALVWSLGFFSAPRFDFAHRPEPVEGAKEKPPTVYALPLPPKPDYSALGWLIGEWNGKAVTPSPPGEARLSVAYDLENRVMVFRETVDFSASPSVPASHEQWMGILSPDAGGKGFLLCQFSSTGFITRYHASAEKAVIHFYPEGGELAPSGWLFRRTLTRTSDSEITESVDAAPPDKPFFNYYTLRFARAAPAPAASPAPKSGALKNYEREEGPKGFIGFAISARMSEGLHAALLAVPAEAWQSTGEDPEVIRECAEVAYVPSEKTEKKDQQPLRYVGIRLRKRQGELFGDGTAVKHFAVVSNIWEWSAPRLLEWHRQKAGTIEMVHDILKNDLAAGVLPCGRFGANAAWLRLAVLAHNVMTALKRLALPPELLSARPKRLRFLIFNTAGRLVRHARQMVLRLAAQRERLAEWIEALRLLWVPAPS